MSEVRRRMMMANTKKPHPVDYEVIFDYELLDNGLLRKLPGYFTIRFFEIIGGDSVQWGYKNGKHPQGFICEYDVNKNFVDYWSVQGGDRVIKTASKSKYVAATFKSEFLRNCYIKNTTTGEYLIEGEDIIIPPVEYIKFEDSEVARVCIQNFSSDGIGVTHNDAIKATTLPSFNGTNIVKFNELKYFENITETPYAINSLHSIFGECKLLQEIDLSNILNIGGYLLAGCSSLSKVVFSKNVKTIDTEAFGGCVNLTTDLNFTELQQIKGQPFNNCNIVNINSLGSIDNIPGNWRDKEKTFGNSVEVIKIPSTVKNIGDYLLNKCNNLKEVILFALEPPIIKNYTLPSANNEFYIYVPDDKIESYKAAPIWSNYIDKIKPMTSKTGYILFEDPEVEKICINNFSSDGIGVTYEDVKKVTNIGRIFENNKTIKKFNEFSYFTSVNKLENNAFASSTIEFISLPIGLKTIGTGAFYACNLINVNFTETCTHVYRDAFRYNGNLRSLGNISNLEYIDETVFDSCKSLGIELNFKKISTIRKSAFNTSGIIKIISLGDIDTLTYACFQGCSKLTGSVTINTCKHIQSYALNETKVDLIKVKLVEDIGSRICDTLKTFVCDNVNIPVIQPNTFSINIQEIYVPDTSIEAYKSAPNWSAFADRIKPLSTYVEPTNY